MAENKKTVKVSEAEYQVMRRDKKVKKDLKKMIHKLYNIIKNWK